MPGGVSSSDQSARVRQLESLLQTYKSEVEGISRDSKDVEARLTQGAGLVKQTDLEESQAEVERLRDGKSVADELKRLILALETGSLHSIISELTTANTTLDAEVNDLMRRVASGEYNPQNERCLELRNNPSAKIQGVRNLQLETLVKENEALLERLRTAGQTASDVANEPSVVPRDSYERLKKEKEALEQNHAKRLMRLKEVRHHSSQES